MADQTMFSVPDRFKQESTEEKQQTQTVAVPVPTVQEGESTKLAVPDRYKAATGPAVGAENMPDVAVDQQALQDSREKQDEISVEIKEMLDSLYDKELARRESMLTDDYVDAQYAYAQQKSDKNEKLIAGIAAASGGKFTEEDIRKQITEKYGDYTDVGKEAADMTRESLTSFMERADKQRNNLYASLTSPNFVTSGLAEKLLTMADEQDLTLGQINAIITADEFLNPVTGVVDVPIYFGEAQENIARGEYGQAALNLSISAASAIPVLGAVAVGKKTVRSTAKALGVKRASIDNYTAAQKAIDAESDIAAKMAEDARIAAEANPETKAELIKAFEQRNGVTISKETNGRIDVDYELVRQAGLDKSQEAYRDSMLNVFRTQAAEEGFKTSGDSLMDSVGDLLTEGKSKTLGLEDLAVAPDELFNPILRSDKLDGLTAAVAELKKKNPNAFKTTNRNATVIDQLFDYTLRGELKETEELMDTLSKYGLSFDDYILTVAGSGSQAGKILNKLSQIKRKKSSVAKAQGEMEAAFTSENAIKSFWNNYFLRAENIRRGAMVSSIATAARNVSSGVVRAPVETLLNVFEESAYRFAKADSKAKGILEAGQAIVPFNKNSAWAESFAEMKYTFAQPNRAKDYTEYLLNRPEFKQINDSMFAGINEIQQLTGRGQATTKAGKAADMVFSALEDGVQALNTPNRLQEHMIRRGTFLGELERLVKSEYGVDLLEELDAGKIRDFLNDATTVRPSGAKSFHSLVDDAARKALDVTYAKQPDFWLFKDISNFITRSGLTTVIPFPRFMFNGLELVGRYSGGAAIPLAKKMAGVALSRQDYRRAGEMLVGWSGIYGAYAYRNSEDAPPEFEMLTTENGSKLDTTPIFPVGQMMYLGEAMKRSEEGTFGTFDPDLSKAAEMFLGSTFRTGTGNVLLEEVRDVVTQTSDIVDEQRRNKVMGRFLGQFAATYFTPFYQLTDAQRLIGTRSEEYRDFGEEPALEGTFSDEFTRSFRQRGFAAPSVEESMPRRETILEGQPERVGLGARLVFGLNFKQADNDAAKTIKKFDFEDFDLSSRSQSPAIRRFENATLREFIPLIADQAERARQNEIAEYANQNQAYKDKYTKDEAGIAAGREEINRYVGLVRSKISDVKSATASPFVQSLMRFRRVPKTQRKAAEREYLKQYGEPDYSDINVIETLTRMAREL
jgi:hypothetical protein